MFNFEYYNLKFSVCLKKSIIVKFALSSVLLICYLSLIWSNKKRQTQLISMLKVGLYFLFLFVKITHTNVFYFVLQFPDH